MKNSVLRDNSICLEDRIEPLSKEMPENFSDIYPEHFPNQNPDNFQFMQLSIKRLMAELREIKKCLNIDSAEKIECEMKDTPEKLILHDYNLLKYFQKIAIKSKAEREIILYGTEEKIYKILKKIHGYDNQTIDRMIELQLNA